MSQTLVTRPSRELSPTQLSRLRGQFLWLGSACLMCVLSVQGVDTQRLSYSSGQNVSPGYEGWEEDPDGSRWFVFGYMNRNWDEEPHVAIGVDNRIEPAGPDNGQPTHFLPRRNRFIFRVPVPDGFGNDDEMVWSLTVNGVTERAYATLRQDYLMDDIIRASEHGAIGAGTTNPTIRANQRSTLRVEGDTTLTVRVGEPLSLVASSSDDGVPESPQKTDPRVRPERPQSLGAPQPGDGQQRDRVAGLLVRLSGRGGDHVRPASDQGVGGYPDRRQFALGATLGDAAPAGRWSVGDRGDVFGTPETDVLRCRASDGALDVDHDLTVTVTS